MLTNTFKHIPKIGNSTEIELWINGIYNWQCAIDKERRVRDILKTRHSDFMTHIHLSISKYKEKDISFFWNALEKSERWRLISDFKDDIVFFDIETTGLNRWDLITIATFFTNNSFEFINGNQVKELQTKLNSCKLIATFNGSCFDLPFLENHSIASKSTIKNIDLRFLLSSLDYSGGQKEIERKTLKQSRDELDWMTGEHAPILWHLYDSTKDEDYLNLLKYYSALDTYNMLHIIEFAYNKKILPYMSSIKYLKPIPLSDYDFKSLAPQYGFDIRKIQKEIKEIKETMYDDHRLNDFPRKQKASNWVYASNKHSHESLFRDTDPHKAGKWLLFAATSEIHKKYWNIIREATESGKLGPSSKASFNEPDQSTKNVICIYSSDANNENDIKRIAREIRRLGINDPLYYKTNMETLSNIYKSEGFEKISKYTSTVSATGDHKIVASKHNTSNYHPNEDSKLANTHHVKGKTRAN